MSEVSQSDILCPYLCKAGHSQQPNDAFDVRQHSRGYRLLGSQREVEFASGISFFAIKL